MKMKTGQFKHSASVQFVARLTGMSLEHAYWVCLVLNFGLIAGVIIWFSKTKLPGMFRSRTASIQKALEEARRASADANRRLAGIEARLAKLDMEIGEMRAAAEQEAVAEEQRIKVAAARRCPKSGGIGGAGNRGGSQSRAPGTDRVRCRPRRHPGHPADSRGPATDQALIRNFAQQLSGNGEPRRVDSDGLCHQHLRARLRRCGFRHPPRTGQDPARSADLSPN